ncbi:unnamed protein product [Rhizoctonia solani]|uniref:Protein kinase domain-containing protein n=1 Tax=Rhizoctonia solani TaxID=456999 RepID=A0A8H3DQ43_9AGAM|nr:unnamed protein product [Rhizoctonia solani]
MDITGLLDLDSVSSDQIRIFGCVYRGRLLDGTAVALETGLISWQEKADFLAIWAKCNHPNIVPLIGMATFRERLAAVYGWHKYDSIREYLNRHPTADRYQLSTQISEGVAYLHSIGIIHGDLDAGRILVSSDGVPRIKLSSFTSSTITDPVQSIWSIAWRAPELGNSGAKYTLASDVFALGMEIIISDEPSYFDKVWAVREMVRRGEPPLRPTDTIPLNDAGNVIWNILCECWTLTPENRPSAKHVCDSMNAIYQSPDGVALRPRRLLVRENTTVLDLLTHFKKRGLANYTQLLRSPNVISTVSVADTALANVYRVELTSHQPIAIKSVKHKTPFKRLKQRAARELDCWSSYQHQNILPVLGFAVFGADLGMVSPWMSNGCVTDYVTRHPYCDRLLLCTQLAQAITYLHENNVVHGDIKGPNVLVSDAGTVQVTDFGVSIADHQEIEFSSTSSGRGTQRWQAMGQAPEILQGHTNSTMEADVYAMGMVRCMFEVYTGEQPYGSVNWPQLHIPVITSQLRPSRPVSLPIDEIGNGIWGLMNHCWAGNPKERQTSGWVYQWLHYYTSINTQVRVRD